MAVQPAAHVAPDAVWRAQQDQAELWAVLGKLRAVILSTMLRLNASVAQGCRPPLVIIRWQHLTRRLLRSCATLAWLIRPLRRLT
jgi:hypothetical protein|eukprot:COSAG01_NODE_1832_length_9109_cov_67.250721_5_plen_85_part_00